MLFQQPLSPAILRRGPDVQDFGYIFFLWVNHNVGQTGIQQLARPLDFSEPSPVRKLLRERISGELPDASVARLRNAGSFDCACDSRCESYASLRMTIGREFCSALTPAWLIFRLTWGDEFDILKKMK